MPVTAGVVAEGPGFRIVDAHLAQGPHDEEDDGSPDQVGQEDGGSGQADGFGRPIEKPSPYGPAQGDELDMAVFQVLAQGLALSPPGGIFLPHGLDSQWVEAGLWELLELPEPLPFELEELFGLGLEEFPELPLEVSPLWSSEESSPGDSP